MRLALALSLILITPALAATPSPSPPSEQAQRLAELARIWGDIAFLHPYVWTRNVDWDAALIRALPKARAATNEDEFARVVDEMLSALHDPLTRVITRDAKSDGKPPAPRAPQPLVEWPRPGVLLLHVGTQASLAPPSIAKAKDEIGKAKSVIFDLRTSDASVGWAQTTALTPLYRQLITRTIYTPAYRSMVHDGYRAQGSWPSADYWSGMAATSGEAIAPAKDARRRRAVFVVDDGSDFPDAGLGMQAIGDAAFVLVGVDSIDQVLAPVRDLGAHHRVAYRTREWLLSPGTPAPHADANLAGNADDAAILQSALHLLSATPRLKPAPPLPAPMWKHDRRYEEMKAPTLDYRLLALFRLWNVIDRFYPYKALLDHKWDDVLIESIPRFEAAEGANAYAEAVALTAARIDDCHTGVHGSTDALAGLQALPPFKARMIEHQPVIVKTLAAAAGARVGDVILTVDGEPVATLLARVRPFVACSNPGSCDLYTLLRALSGADGSMLALTVRGADGQTRSLSLPRRTSFNAEHRNARDGEIVRLLDGNIGYVDLDRLEQSGVDAMFAKLEHTRAIIFDMRGYPNQTAWPIAPRLNVNHAVDAARFERPVVRGDSTDYRHSFVQPLPTNDKPLYRGKTFMLVDERTISQAEHTGLFFEAAASTKFVGSASAGANGDVTVLVLPGELAVTFTGHNVRHADGRQLQRVGLPVDFPVMPTIAGVQAGRDEVLERALAIARK